MGKTHATSRVCVFYVSSIRLGEKPQTSKCSKLPLVTFDIATIVWDGSHPAEEKKRKEDVGKRKTLAFFDKLVLASESPPLHYEQFITEKETYDHVSISELSEWK